MRQALSRTAQVQASLSRPSPPRACSAAPVLGSFLHLTKRPWSLLAARLANFGALSTTTLAATTGVSL